MKIKKQPPQKENNMLSMAVSLTVTISFLQTMMAKKTFPKEAKKHFKTLINDLIVLRRIVHQRSIDPSVRTLSEKSLLVAKYIFEITKPKVKS